MESRPVSHPADAAEVLSNFLNDVVSNLPNSSHAVLNINELPDDFRELGKKVKFLGKCVRETGALADNLSKGILTGKLPSRRNIIAAPLKSLHASLKHLTWQTRQIAQGDYNQRVDFMGEFSASFNRMVEQLSERDALLQTVNHIAAVLLSTNENRPFDSLLIESIEIICNCVGVDRAHIWRSGTLEGGNVLFHSYEWNIENEDERKRIPLNTPVPYDTFPRWEDIIIRGEILHGPYSAMPPDVREFFEEFEMKSIIIIPMFLHSKFWGMFTLDCKIERTFSEEEIHILQSAGLMMINAMLRNETLDKIKEEHEKTERLAHWYHSILDAIPLPISVTDTDMNWEFINMAVEKLLGGKRNEMLGRHCSNWNAHICNTDKCGIACIKRGIKQTYFIQNNLSFKVDVETLKDLNGQTAGYIEIVQDITEIESMTKKKAEAEEASKAKSIFLANMSHEMRTPMNAILGIAEIYLQEKTLSAETAKAFSRIYESGDLLLKIINDILDLSKIEAGKLEIMPVKYDIPSLVNDTVQLNRMRYDSKQLSFTLNVDENTPYNLYGDELRIKQILNNVLSNAFKYTEKGIIDFSISSEPETDGNITLVLRVSDTGQGMTEEQIAVLFDEYTRFNADANRTTVGTGLGMSITKHLVGLMNGAVSVESEPSIGSIFTIRLPQKLAGSAVCGSELSSKLREFRFQNILISKKLQFIREYMPYGKVLVVDDVEINLYVAKGLLSPYGLTVESVSSAFETIEKIKNGEVYDIIFMDHMMPKMDGIEAVKIIRDMGYAHPIIALTANVLIGQEKMFLDNGFDGFISKPTDSRELNNILNDFIRNKKPREVVEAARREQEENEKKNIFTAQNTESKSLSNEAKLILLKDAINAVTVLGNLYQKINVLNDEEINLYIITVHGMKSALANVGERDLSGIALNLEQAGKQRNLEVMTNVTPIFTAALHSMIAELRSANKDEDTVNKESSANKKSREISGGDALYLSEKMLEIKTACKAFDKDTARTALNVLRQKEWPENVNDVLDDITMHISHSAFKKAADASQEFIK